MRELCSGMIVTVLKKASNEEIILQYMGHQALFSRAQYMCLVIDFTLVILIYFKLTEL